MSDYNGWTNRETWLVNLHFDPLTREDLIWIKDLAEQEVDDIESAFIKDLIDLSRINWRELEEHVQEDEE